MPTPFRPDRALKHPRRDAAGATPMASLRRGYPASGFFAMGARAD